MEQLTLNFSRKKIAIFLIIIIAISLIFKLYFLDLEIPVISDRLDFAMRALAYSDGEFTIQPKQNPGWPLFVSLFYGMIDSGNLIDYSAILKSLTVGITTVTIIPIYFLARKFFDERYSLVAASLFAFEPHLNRWSTLGFTEPLYILVMIGSFYFILSKNMKYFYLSFLLAGFLWWIRLEGIVMFFVLTAIFFINFRGSTRLVGKYVVCIGIFLLVISPILFFKNEQFGDPFYNYYLEKIFVEENAMLSGENLEDERGAASEFLQRKGIGEFLNVFLVGGISNLIEGLIKLSFPYLMILVPFGMLFSLRVFEMDKKYIKAIWILLLVFLGFLIIPYSVISEKRFIFFVFPFFIIFATLIIRRVTEHGLSTFSFNRKQKDVFIILVLLVIVILATFFILRYEVPDRELENEKMEFSRFLINNLEGKFVDTGYNVFYIRHIIIENNPEIISNIKLDPEKGDPQFYKNRKIFETDLYANSIEELLLVGKNNELNYLIIGEENIVRQPYLSSVYYNEENYPYLIKIFDSNEKGFNKFKVKMFEIDYQTFEKFQT